MVRVGIDIGGTGIKVGIIDAHHSIIGEGTIPTLTDIPFEAQVQNMAKCVEDTAAKAGVEPYQIEMVGVGIPGIANSAGEVIKCTNMGWFHVPFRSVFRRFLDVPVRIDKMPMWPPWPKALPVSARAPLPAFSSPSAPASAAASSLTAKSGTVSMASAANWAM